MSTIKQISVYNGTSWNTNNIGVNAGNVELLNEDGTLASTIAESTNLLVGLTNILPSNKLTADRVLVSDNNGKISISSNITSTQLNYLDGINENIKTALSKKLAVNGGLAYGLQIRWGLKDNRDLAEETPRIEFRNGGPIDETVLSMVYYSTDNTSTGNVIFTEDGTFLPSKANVTQLQNYFLCERKSIVNQTIPASGTLQSSLDCSKNNYSLLGTTLAFFDSNNTTSPSSDLTPLNCINIWNVDGTIHTISYNSSTSAKKCTVNFYAFYRKNI